ncbi:MAG: hypothetical protein WCG45_04380, partial [bacterium]
KKKKVDGKKKGNRTELDLTKVLNARFKTGFSRSVGSGNRWSQTVLPKHAQDIFSGDLVVPQGFKFVIESKGGYDDVDLSNIFLKGNNVIDSFLKQVTSDSKRCDRKPLLCWKKTRKPWLAFVLTKDLPEEDNFQYSLRYRNWTAVALDELLQLSDDFFLE